jgi:starch phosphorylase
VELNAIRAIKCVLAGAFSRKAKSPLAETEEIWRWPTTRLFQATIPTQPTPCGLWNAQASSEINLGKFNQGDYFAAVEDKTTPKTSPACSIRMTRPIPAGSCACAQEYFLVSATVQDILSRHYQLHKTYANLAEKTAIHLNDTHRYCRSRIDASAD